MGFWAVLFGHRSGKVADHQRRADDRAADERAEQVQATAERAYVVARRLDTQLAILQHRQPRDG